MIKGKVEALNPEHMGTLQKRQLDPGACAEGVRKIQWDKKGGARLHGPSDLLADS